MRLLKEDERTRGIPVVVVSVRDDLQETLKEGAAAALPKPLDREGFASTVIEVLAKCGVQ